MKTARMTQGVCDRCRTPMYKNSRGDYACRNFDCPPGTEKRHHVSWGLQERLRPLLLQQNAALFTVDELGLILNPDFGEHCGPRMLEIAKRLGLKLPPRASREPE